MWRLYWYISGVWLTKLVLGLNSVLCGNTGSTANPVSGTDSEQVHIILLEATDAVLWSISMICGKSPGLTLHVTSFHNIGNDLASAITLWLLPGQTNFTIGSVNHSQVLHRSGDI